MIELKELYNELANKYQVEWTDESQTSFSLFFKDNKDREYELIISDERIEVLKEKTLLNLNWQDEIAHQHFDYDGVTNEDMIEAIERYLAEYRK